MGLRWHPSYQTFCRVIGGANLNSCGLLLRASGFPLAENDKSQEQQQPALVARLLRIELERPECSANLWAAQIGFAFPVVINLLDELLKFGQSLGHCVFGHGVHAWSWEKATTLRAPPSTSARTWSAHSANAARTSFA